MVMHNHDDARADMMLRAAQRALELVECGMIVGSGSGSKATFFIKLVGKQIRSQALHIRAIASSEDSERLGRSCGTRRKSGACRTVPYTDTHL